MWSAFETKHAFLFLVWYPEGKNMKSQENDITISEQNYGTLLDVFAATPLGRKGREALQNLKTDINPDDFFDNIYVQPFNSLKDENSLPEEDIGKSPEEYISESTYEILTQFRFDRDKYVRLEGERKYFEKCFIDNLSKALYIITGAAGCGKTTYFHHLWHKMAKNHTNTVKLYFCDLEESYISFSFLKKMPESFSRENNVCIFVGFILNEILHNIFYTETIDENNNEIHKKFIGSIVEIYNKYFNIVDSKTPRPDDLQQALLFNELNECHINEMNRKDFFERFGKYVIQQIDSFIKNKEEVLAVEFVFGIVIRMFFCLSKITGNKYICAIDSIEHYISNSKRRLQNTEITNIIEGIKKATDNIRARLDEIRKVENPYTPFYGIIIMMRDTSEKIVHLTDQQDEYGHRETISVDVSEWFDAKSIIDNKEKYFIKYIGANDQTVKAVIDNVKNDLSTYRWGLHGMITRMYNYNQRGIADCLVKALSVKKNDKLEWFNEKWSEALKLKSDVLKYMCRQYIFRILLDYVEDTNYFSGIMAASNGDVNSESTSYARKISTVLHNWSLINGKNYASFNYLVKSVLVTKENTFPSKQNIRDLAKILCLMNEPDTEKTHWNALIEIKFNPNEEYNENSLCTALLHDFNNNKINSTENYGVRVRTSGSFFADIVPEFEYFSCRLMLDNKKRYRPLFELANLKKNKKNEFCCVETIREVRKHTFDCINAVIVREKDMPKDKIHWLYKRKRNISANVHPLRIFIQHIGYLENFQDYLSYYVAEKNFVNQDKNTVIKLIKKEIYEYKEKFNECKIRYKNYFDLG